MRITNYVATITVCASLLGTPACSKAEGDTKQTSIDELTQAEVDTLMQRSSVDEILKEEYQSSRIKKVEYNNGKTNFRELVYQEHLPAAQRKPVIMLVADGDGIGGLKKDRYCSDKGDAIVVKHLANKYKDFVVITYDPSVAPDFVQINDGKVKFGSELKEENVSVCPSILIYGAKPKGDFERLLRFNGGPLGPSANTDVLKFEKDLTEKIKSYGL